MIVCVVHEMVWCMFVSVCVYGRGPTVSVLLQQYFSYSLSFFTLVFAHFLENSGSLCRKADVQLFLFLGYRNDHALGLVPLLRVDLDSSGSPWPGA